MRKVRIFRNTSTTKRWGTARLPIQRSSGWLRLIWVGPVFLLVSP